MNEKDLIAEIGIDSEERLFVRPTKKSYPMIYRDAAEVHWDADKGVLYSPKPREWSYTDWFKHILCVADPSCDGLYLNGQTKWSQIPQPLRSEIETWMQKRKPAK